MTNARIQLFRLTRKPVTFTQKAEPENKNVKSFKILQKVCNRD